MATITYNSSLVEQNIKNGLILESSLGTPTSEFEGTAESDAAFVVIDRADADRGDNIEIRFDGIDLNEKPKTVDDPTVGAESGTNEYTDRMEMRYFKWDRYINNVPVEQNLANWSLKDQRLRSISLSVAYHREKAIMNQLTGNTLVNSEPDYRMSGGNIVTAQDARHIIYCPDGSGANTTPAAVAADTTSILTTRVIDDLQKRASSFDYVRWPSSPADTPLGKKLHILMVGADGYEQIRQNGAASDFYDLSVAAIQGGEELMSSPLMTGEGFIYRNTLVLKTQWSPNGITSAAAQVNTRMAAFFGARAGHYMYGGGWTEGNNLGYSEFMVHRRLSMLADTMYGFKRTIVNGESWSSFAVVHYSPVA